MTVRECIEKFINNKNNYFPYDKRTVKNILTDSGDNEFFNGIRDYLDKEYIESTEYAESVKAFTRGYTSHKDTAIAIFRKLTDFLERKLNCKLLVPFPPIQVSSEFERIMYMAKYLQTPDNKVSALEDILWVSNRTLQTDISTLRGEGGLGLPICGKDFIIEDLEQRNGSLHFKSTVHPLFLVENLTQVIVMLEGLSKMAENCALRPYAMATARDIWNQLSDYGKNRIQYVLSHLMFVDNGWIDELNKENDNRFISEALCIRTEGHNAIIDCLKNEKECYIEYDGIDGTIFYEAVKVSSFYGENFTIEENGKSTMLETRRVVHSAPSKEGLL